jgi:hypothetical protein
LLLQNQKWLWASVAVLLVLVIGDKLLELVSDWLRSREC